MGGKSKSAKAAEADARRSMERWMVANSLSPGSASSSSSDPLPSMHATQHTAKRAAEAAEAPPKKRPRRLKSGCSDPPAEEAVEHTLAPDFPAGALLALEDDSSLPPPKPMGIWRAACKSKAAPTVYIEPTVEPPLQPKPECGDSSARFGGPGFACRPLCSKCKVELDPLKSQVTGKSMGNWKCNTCNSRTTQLHREFGAWPIEDFKMLDAAAQEVFWAEARKCHGIRNLKELLIEHLTRHRIEREAHALKGTYLPLSVYGQRGFDTARILEYCEDKRWDQILGWTYRVNLFTVSHESIEETVRKEVLSLTKKKKPCASAGADAASVAAVICDSQESSSTANTSSSSSTANKQKKKRKKNNSDNKKSVKKDGKKKSKKKNKKNVKSEPSDSESVQRKPKGQRSVTQTLKTPRFNAKKVKVFAAKVMAKVQPEAFMLEMTLKDKAMKHMPTFAVAACKEGAKALQSLLSECKARMKAKDDEVTTMPFELKHVEACVKEAEGNRAILQNMLSAAHSMVP